MNVDGLSGLVVLEVAETLGAAFAVSLLADYKATAIVCEPPHGSPLRRLGPGWISDMRWKILARNKKSIAANWNDPASQALIHRLLARADLLVVDTAGDTGSPWFKMLDTMPPAERPLVVEVFPTGTDRPDLWPWSTRPEFAGAASGVMALTGHTGKTPIQAEAPLTDYLAGTLAATKALITLRKSQLTRTAPGTVSTPLHQAVQRMIEWQTPVAVVKGRAETRMANNFPMNAGIANMHPTAEGKYVAISAVTQATAMRLMNMVGGPKLCADPRYATPEARSTGLDELYAKIDAWTGARTTQQILETAASQDVVLGPIYSTDDILADEQVAARGVVVTANGLTQPNVTPRFSGLQPAEPTLGPAIGANTAEIVAALTSHPSGHPPPGGGLRIHDPLPHQAGGSGEGDPAALNVVELGAVIAGPFAGSMMAELGGAVIKVETPGAGDSLRGMGPQKDGTPIWFGCSAREKQCVTINLKDPKGKAIFEELIARADVLVENFRPGVLERLGLDWTALSKLNPKLVMLSISGFGQTGPQKLRPGFGKIAEGISGIVNLTGEAGQSPLFVGFSLADASAGLFGVYGVAAGLYRRDVLGGDGARIDIALFEPLMRMLDCQLALHAADGKAPERRGSNDPYSFGVEGGDRPRFLSVGSESGDWYLLAVSEADEARLKARVGELQEWGRTRANAAIEGLLKELGLEYAPIFDGMTIARSPYFQARGDVVATEHPAVGKLTAAGRIDGVRGTTVFRAPGLGEDNAAVFGRLLGMDEAKIDRLIAEGVI
jgi:crotonobetainyl-CoA:carnitine CoA-transferase CaiB-like acyl-CoA transferase